VEKRIGPVHDSPNDYKVYVFDGDPYMVLVDLDRFGRHRSRFYTAAWEPMRVRDRVLPSARCVARVV